MAKTKAFEHVRVAMIKAKVSSPKFWSNISLLLWLWLWLVVVVRVVGMGVACRGLPDALLLPVLLALLLVRDTDLCRLLGGEEVPPIR